MPRAWRSARSAMRPELMRDERAVGDADAHHEVGHGLALAARAADGAHAVALAVDAPPAEVRPPLGRDRRVTLAREALDLGVRLPRVQLALQALGPLRLRLLDRVGHRPTPIPKAREPAPGSRSARLSPFDRLDPAAQRPGVGCVRKIPIVDRDCQENGRASTSLKGFSRLPYDREGAGLFEPAYTFRRGSSVSRSPSPNRLIPSTVTRIASPGNRDRTPLMRTHRRVRDDPRRGLGSSLIAEPRRIQADQGHLVERRAVADHLGQGIHRIRDLLGPPLRQISWSDDLSRTLPVCDDEHITLARAMLGTLGRRCPDPRGGPTEPDAEGDLQDRPAISVPRYGSQDRVTSGCRARGATQSRHVAPLSQRAETMEAAGARRSPPRSFVKGDERPLQSPLPSARRGQVCQDRYERRAWRGDRKRIR